MWKARIPARSARLVLALGLSAAAVLTTIAEARAQGWWWPWGNQSEPPRPREPLRQPPPYPPGQPGQQPPPMGQPAPYGQRGPSNLCLQLEQRLVSEVQGQGQGRELLPKIEQDMREADRAVRSANVQLDRSDCWDQFLFSKTLRRTRRCIDLNTELETNRQRLADLDRQRRQIMGTGERSSMRDDIIRELARNGCGQQYVQEARKRETASNPFAMIFGGEEPEEQRGPANQFGNLPFATYRTLCVRLCDGYYFPVSFSTLPNHFQRDAQVCQSQCAAPAELFYHQNPGGAVEQMVSVNGQPYTSLKTAFRYRKEYTAGCSCKQAEYSPAVEKKADAAPAQSVPQSSIRLGATRQ
jgi:hypothetical protein